LTAKTNYDIIYWGTQFRQLGDFVGKRDWNSEKYSRYLHEGRGAGEMEGYKPWLTINDLPSLGVSSRVYSHKTNRMHHLLSNGELWVFYLLEDSENVLDIREQYPLLDVELAIDIAQKEGIRYPKDAKSKFPYVLTSDFLVTTTEGLKVRTVKQSSELSKKRVLEKLHIERLYWNAKGVDDWKIVTEMAIDTQKAKKLQWLRLHKEFDFIKTIPGFKSLLIETKNLCLMTNASAQKAGKMVDNAFSLKVGSGYALVLHLVANKELPWEVVASLS
jgi:hypothetical protein